MRRAVERLGSCDAWVALYAVTVKDAVALFVCPRYEQLTSPSPPLPFVSSCQLQETVSLLPAVRADPSKERGW